MKAMAAPVLRRKCACGKESPEGASCSDCSAKQSRRLQKQLMIGASNDPLEREADRVADQVMGSSASPTVTRRTPQIQRYSRDVEAEGGAAPASVDAVLASPGRPMDPALREDMEQRFGYDFSGVRVHSDEAAERSARDVQAHAYTVGSNIVFAEARFAPSTSDGRRLLSHELTHVIQQTGAEGAWSGASNGFPGQANVSSKAPAKVSLGTSVKLAREPISAAEAEKFRSQGWLGPDAAGDSGGKEARPDTPSEQARVLKAHESGANWAKGGNPINPSVERSHFAPGEREAFIRGFIEYAKLHSLTPQYEDARKSYPWAEPKAAVAPQKLKNWLDVPPANVPRRVEPDRETKAEKSKRQGETDLDLVETAAEKGVIVPSVSDVAVDPRSNSDFVERRCTGVGYGIYVGITSVAGGGYLLYCNDLDLPLLLPAVYVNFGGGPATFISGVIQNSREDALNSLPIGPRPAGQPEPYAFYRAAGGLIVPTMFTPTTTPRLVELILEARKQWVKEVTDELTVLFLTMVGAKLIFSARGLVRSGKPHKPSAASGPQRKPPAVPKGPQVTPDHVPAVAEEAPPVSGIYQRADIPQVGENALTGTDAARAGPRQPTPPGGPWTRPGYVPPGQPKLRSTTPPSPRKSLPDVEFGKRKPSATDVKSGPRTLSEHADELGSTANSDEKLTTRKQGEKPLTQRGQIARAGQEIEASKVAEFGQRNPDYQVISNTDFAKQRGGWLKRVFPAGNSGPDAVAISDKKRIIKVFDSSGSPNAEHIEKTINYKVEIKANLPEDLHGYTVEWEESYWQAGEKGLKGK